MSVGPPGLVRTGEVDIEDCRRPEPEPVSVVVTGKCIRDRSFARIGIDVEPDGGATVALTAASGIPGPLIVAVLSGRGPAGRLASAKCPA